MRTKSTVPTTVSPTLWGGGGVLLRRWWSRMDCFHANLRSDCVEDPDRPRALPPRGVPTEAGEALRSRAPTWHGVATATPVTPTAVGDHVADGPGFTVYGAHDGALLGVSHGIFTAASSGGVGLVKPAIVPGVGWAFGTSRPASGGLVRLPSSFVLG